MCRRICFLLLAFLLCGCGDENKTALTEAELDRIAAEWKSDLPDMLVVAGETITCDEIIATTTERDGVVVSLKESFEPIARARGFEEFKEWARPQIKQILMTKISNALLYYEAKKKLGEEADETLEKLTDSDLRKFVLNYGGDQAKADEALKKMGMDRESFKEDRKRFILTQWHVASKLSDTRPVTYTELMECYNRIKEESFALPAMVKIRLIDIQLARLEVTDPNRSRQDQARELADELLARLRGGEDFGALAKQYSHGPRREYDGLWKSLNPESFAEPYDILAVEAEKMQPGQVAGPLENSGHIFIVKLEEKRSKGYEPLEKVQDQIEQIIATERWKRAVDKLNSELMQNANLEETDAFIDFCLEKLYRMSNQ